MSACELRVCVRVRARVTDVSVKAWLRILMSTPALARAMAGFVELITHVPCPEFVSARVRGTALVLMSVLSQPPPDEASILSYVTWYVSVYEHFAARGVRFSIIYDLSRIHGAPDLAIVNMKWRLTQQLIPRTSVQVVGFVILTAPEAAGLVTIVRAIFAARQGELTQRALTSDPAEVVSIVAQFGGTGAIMTDAERAQLRALPIDTAAIEMIVTESCAL